MSPNVRRYIALFALSMGAAASYNLPYIKYVFYDAWVAGLGLRPDQDPNTAAGFLLTWHMIGCILLYIPGGYIADKFSAKNIIIISLCGTGMLNIWYAFDPSLAASTYIWPLLAVSVGFAYWSGMIKAVRMLGSAQEQGRMYGWYNSGEGFFASSFLACALVAYAFAKKMMPDLPENDPVVMLQGLKYATLVQGGTCFLAALCTLVFFDNKLTIQGDISDDEKFKAQDIFKVVKNPWVWVCSVIGMCCYGTYTGQSYLTPYMTDVLKMSTFMAGIFAIIRTKGTRFIGGPIGGILADKIGSPAKIIIVSNAGMILFFGLLFILPRDIHPALVVTITLTASVFTFIGYNIMFAVIEEAGIPRYLMGTTVGIMSMLTYTPDGLINPVFGWFLDKYGDGGYTYIFLSLIALCILGSIFCVILFRRGNDLRKAKTI